MMNITIFEKNMDNKGANATFVYVYCYKCKRQFTHYKENSSDRSMLTICPICDKYIKVVFKMRM
jgi:NAD-dependent SIR2 family protein deacetylase